MFPKKEAAREQGNETRQVQDYCTQSCQRQPAKRARFAHGYDVSPQVMLHKAKRGARKRARHQGQRSTHRKAMRRYVAAEARETEREKSGHHQKKINIQGPVREIHPTRGASRAWRRPNEIGGPLASLMSIGFLFF